MMSLETMREVSREKAAQAAAENRTPYIVRAGDVDDWLAGHGWPLPFPEIGDYVPDGWQHVRTLFCDHSGFGRDDEPALSIEQMLRELKTDRGYAITEVGQFQLRLGEYKPPSCVREEPAEYQAKAPAGAYMTEEMHTAIIELVDLAHGRIENGLPLHDGIEELRREIHALHLDALQERAVRICFEIGRAKGTLPSDDLQQALREHRQMREEMTADMTDDEKRKLADDLIADAEKQPKCRSCGASLRSSGGGSFGYDGQCGSCHHPRVSQPVAHEYDGEGNMTKPCNVCGWRISADGWLIIEKGRRDDAPLCAFCKARAKQLKAKGDRS